MAHTKLKEIHKLIIESEFFIMLDKILEMIWVDNNIKTTVGSSLKFLCSNTGEANSLPDFRNISFLGSFESLLIFAKHHIYLGKLLVISNSIEKKFSSVIELVMDTFLSNFLNISLIWVRDKVFKLTEIFISTFSIRKDKLRINDLLFEGLSGH